MEAVENRKLKKSVRVRLQKEEAAKQKEANSGNQGDASASLKSVPTSPRKMRVVADMVRGHRVNYALNVLRFDAKHSSAKLEKLLLSAISNWQAKNEDIKIEDADLYIKDIYVDSAKILKRLRPAPQGRAHRIRKRSNHVAITISNNTGADLELNSQND